MRVTSTVNYSNVVSRDISANARFKTFRGILVPLRKMSKVYSESGNELVKRHFYGQVQKIEGFSLRICLE